MCYSSSYMVLHGTTCLLTNRLHQEAPLNQETTMKLRCTKEHQDLMTWPPHTHFFHSCDLLKPYIVIKTSISWTRMTDVSLMTIQNSCKRTSDSSLNGVQISPTFIIKWNPQFNLNFVPLSTHAHTLCYCTSECSSQANSAFHLGPACLGNDHPKETAAPKPHCAMMSSLQTHICHLLPVWVADCAEQVTNFPPMFLHIAWELILAWGREDDSLQGGCWGQTKEKKKCGVWNAAGMKGSDLWNKPENDVKM